MALLASTYAGYVASLADPDWQARTRLRLQGLLEEMLSLELLEEEGGVIRLTLLGRACGRSSLSFRSCLRLVQLLRRHGTTASSATLMLLIQGLAECDDAYTPVMPKAKKEKARPNELLQRVGEPIVRELQKNVADEKTFLQRCKRSLVLLDWTAGVPMGDIEQRYSASPFQGKIGLGDVRRLADLTRYHLRAASEIARVLLISAGPTEDDTEKLLRSLEFGIPSDRLELLDVAAGWSRGEILTLLDAEVRTPSQLWSLSAERGEQLLGRNGYARLERMRPP